MNPRNMALFVRRPPAADAGRFARRVLFAQMAAAGVCAVLVWVISDPRAAVSLLVGTLVVALPQWCAHRLLRVGSLGLWRLVALEGLRVGASVVLLLYGAVSLPGFTWWAALVGLILAVKVPWFVLLRED